MVHADFYRLRGVLELENLGWDEAIAEAIAIVEWPERIAEALPARRLEVRILFDPSHDPGWRILELRGFGQVAKRLARALGIGAILKRAGWSEARREFLQGDASIRAYERLTKPGGDTAILMISPPRADGPIVRYGKPYAAIAKLSPDIRAFIAMVGGLRKLGYSAPELFAYSVEDGLALMEDLGAATVVENGVADRDRYAEATALLVDLHGRDLPDALPVGDEVYRLPTYDIEAMLVEVELVIDWYAQAIAKVTVPSGARMQFLAIWRDLLSPILAERTTWTLRDYHSPNLHWLPKRDGIARIGLLDFQDAVLGPPAYDLASLLQDARVDIPDDLEIRLAALYVRGRSAADAGFDSGRFAAAYAAMGAQRATKISGNFRAARQAGRQAPVSATLAADRAHPRQEPCASVAEAPRPLVSEPPAAGVGKRLIIAGPYPGTIAIERADSENGNGVRRGSGHAHAPDHRYDAQAAGEGRRQNSDRSLSRSIGRERRRAGDRQRPLACRSDRSPSRSPRISKDPYL